MTRTQGRLASPSGASDRSATADVGKRSGWAAAGGILGAVAASSCCIVPLMLFSLGVSGSWISRLTALEPYKPLFIAIAVSFLGYGYWLIYRPPAATCEACARARPGRLVRSALWISTALIVLALFWDSIAPVVAPIMLGL